MSNALKAALLSGLVFPGLGQVVLKRYRRGVVLMLVVFACLSVVAAIALQRAVAILRQIESAGGAIDIDAILNAAAQSSTASDSLIVNYASSLIIVGWIFGIIDAYRVGRKRDLEERSTRQGPNSTGDQPHNS